ncbi:MAG TPA: hypothetical protein PKH46_06110 [Candidatus Cryosericum sp.]|nr:hypothetical protein [Candidatus Cryosericum sp.]
MSVAVRIEFPGAVHLVSNTADMLKDGLAETFVAALQKTSALLRWDVYAWCVLPDRYRLIVRTAGADLETGMRQLASACTRHLPQSGGHRVPAFSHPYCDTLLDPEGWLLPACRSVLTEPANAGLVAAAGDWAWSSYRETMSGKGPLAAWFSPDDHAMPAAFDTFLRAGSPETDPVCLSSPQEVLGSPAFRQSVAEHLVERASEPGVAAALIALTRPSLAEIFGSDARRERTQLRPRIEAAVRLGYSRAEIARQLGVHYTTVSRCLRPPDAPRRQKSR